MKKVYLAGKVQKGLTGQAAEWREKFTALVKDKDIIFLDPNTADYAAMPIQRYFGRDVHMIFSADIVVAEASEKMGLGTAQEMLIAKYYGKPVITIAPPGTHYDKEIETVAGKKRYVHPFLSATSDAVASSYEEAAKILQAHLAEEKTITPKRIDLIEKERRKYEEEQLPSDEYVKNATSK